MILEVYYSKREDSYTAIVAGNDPYDFSGDAELITEIEGVNWDECMAKYHEYMDWEPYKPDSINLPKIHE